MKCSVTIKRGKCEIIQNNVTKSFRSLGSLSIFVDETINSCKQPYNSKLNTTIYNVNNPMYFLLLCKLHVNSLTDSNYRKQVELILEDDYNFILRVTSVSGQVERKILTKTKQLIFDF